MFRECHLVDNAGITYERFFSRDITPAAIRPPANPNTRCVANGKAMPELNAPMGMVKKTDIPSLKTGISTQHRPVAPAIIHALEVNLATLVKTRSMAPPNKI